MKRFAALAGATLLAGCGTGPSPAGPPSELLFATTASGHAVVQTRSGHTVASLPPGPLAVALTAGGDVAEAWLVTPGGGGQRLLRLRPAQGFAAAEVAAEPVPGPPQAALVPAPLLTSFSGAKTVLAVRYGDGRLAGYQNGSLLWRLPPGSGDELRWTESAAFLHTGAGWRQVKPETGDLAAPLGAGCEPVAAVGADLAELCSDGLEFRGRTFAARAANPWSAATFDGGAILGWKDGGIARLPRGGAGRFGQTAAMAAPPAGAPDLDQAYLLAASDELALARLSTGKTSYFATPRDASSLGISRDGNFVYALGGGRLEVFRAGDRQLAGDYAAEGSAIEFIAGG